MASYRAPIRTRDLGRRRRNLVRRRWASGVWCLSRKSRLESRRGVADTVHSLAMDCTADWAHETPRNCEIMDVPGVRSTAIHLTLPFLLFPYNDRFLFLNSNTGFCVRGSAAYYFVSAITAFSSSYLVSTSALCICIMGIRCTGTHLHDIFHPTFHLVSPSTSGSSCLSGLGPQRRRTTAHRTTNHRKRACPSPGTSRLANPLPWDQARAALLRWPRSSCAVYAARQSIPSSGEPF